MDDGTSDRNVIIVAGHASFLGSLTQTPAEPELDDAWALKPYQKGEPPFFIEHIRRGVEIAAASPESLLVFSGGITTAAARHWSEAHTYCAIAEHFQWWSYPEVASRAITEEFARDSFENILFSFFAFYLATGTYPTSVTVVSWQFKSLRFELHRKALRIPTNRFHFIGVGSPPRLEDAVRGESETVESFSRDPWGRRPPLCDKRTARTYSRLKHGYAECRGAAQVFKFLEDSTAPNSGPTELPWDCRPSD